MKHVALPNGERVPVLGMGTWNMGDDRTTRAEEIATLHLGLDLGLRLIDMIGMYGEDLSESLIGGAIAGRRDDVFPVSKVYPYNASRHGIAAACERSLYRFGTDRLDLYLLHWRGDVPLKETLEGLQALQREGKTRQYGVSSLDLSDMGEWWGASDGDQTTTNRLFYSLSRCDIEWDVLPWLYECRVPVMTYSPIGQARPVRHSKLVRFVWAYGMTPAQAAFAWLLANDDIIAIPKTGRHDRLCKSIGALSHTFMAEQFAMLDSISPLPKGPYVLEML